MQVPVVILAYTKNPQIYEMTKKCIESLHASESDYKFEVILVETNPYYTEIGNYEDAKVIAPQEPFNYNRFLNLAFKELDLTKYEYCVISNNDVVFYLNWFSKIVEGIKETGVDSASAFSPGWHTHEQYCLEKPYYEGFEIGKEFCGWNLVFKTESLQKLLFLDESFLFWCQDNDLAIRMDQLKMKHVLVRDSKVWHLGNQSHQLVDNQGLFEEYTAGMIRKFHEKWG